MLNAADLALLGDLSSRAEGGTAQRLAAKHVIESVQRLQGRVGRSFKGAEASETLAGLTQVGDPPPVMAPRLIAIDLLTNWDQPAYIAARQALMVGL